MLVSASTNPPKQEEMLGYIKSLENSGIDFVHCDCMDGVLVKAKTFDYAFLPKIREVSTLPLDVHIMVHNPAKVYKKYVEYGANILSVHHECFENKRQLIEVLNDIKSIGCKPSIAVKIESNIEDVFEFLPYCENVLVMSVKIGKSGQTFDQTAIEKIKKLTKFIKQNKLNITIEVDGGVNDQNVATLNSLGVDCVVVGGYLFGSSDKNLAVKKLKNC